MLSHAYFLAKFRFDTAENEPAKKLQNFARILQNLPVGPGRAALPGGVERAGPRGRGGLRVAHGPPDHGPQRLRARGALQRAGRCGVLGWLSSRISGLRSQQSREHPKSSQLIF